MNEKEFNFLGITRWHDLGYKGKGIIICSKEEILDGVFDDVFGLSFEYEKDKYSTHATEVMDYIRQVAPEADKWAIETAGMTTRSHGSEVLEKSERVEWLRNNPPDVLTTSYFKSTDFYEYIQELYRHLYKNGCFMCLAAGNEDEGIEKLATIDIDGNDMWKAIGACNYLPSKDKAQRQLKYATGEEMDYMSLHRLTCTWDNEKHAGTSFSSPLFAGMVALVQGFFLEKAGKKLDLKQLNKFIQDNCIDLEEKGVDIKTGHGLFILPDPATIKIEDYCEVVKVEEKEEKMFKDYTEWEKAIEFLAEQGEMDSPKYWLERISCENDVDLMWFCIKWANAVARTLI